VVQSAPPVADLGESLLGILVRYVSAPTAQSILKLARQRANVGTPRLDRTQISEMFAPIERNLRLFVREPSKVDECCAAIQALLATRAVAPSSARSPESASAWAVPPSSTRSGEPPSVRSPSSTRSPEPPSVRSAPPASVRSPSPSAVIAIRVEDDIARARSEARDLASTIGFSVVGRTRLVTAVSELARNIVLYAREGQLELTAFAAPAGMGVVASDRGPGIPNLEQIMVGDYKSRLGMGLGLRGVKRLADRFEVQTAVGQGTTVTFFLKVI
jgi:serine/threonine-protein kinase RsbT